MSVGFTLSGQTPTQFVDAYDVHVGFVILIFHRPDQMVVDLNDL